MSGIQTYWVVLTTIDTEGREWQRLFTFHTDTAEQAATQAGEYVPDGHVPKEACVWGTGPWFFALRKVPGYRAELRRAPS